MKFTLITLLCLLATALTAPAGEFNPREVFETTPARDVDAALKRAAKDKKKVLLFSYDPKEGGNFPGFDITSFMDTEAAKKLVKDHFILVLLTRGHPDLAKYTAPGPPEKAYYALLRPDGTAVKTDTVFRNPGVGLRVLNELVALP